MSNQPPARDSDRGATIERRVSDMLRQAGVPGAVLALSIDGQHWTHAIGHRDLSRAVPLAADAVMPIYSVTKPLIAAAVLDLVARGPAALDQPVAPRLTGIELDPRLTLRHLLNHTGGLPDYGEMGEYHEELRRHPERPWTDDEFLNRVLARGPRFAPGEGWAYSNIGYLLLRRILTQATGRSLRDVLTVTTFTPLRLRHAQVLESLADSRDLAPGFSAYFADDQSPVDVRPRYHPGWVSHGLAAASAADVATFLDALLGERLVPSALLTEMLVGVDVPETHPRFRRATYGLGLMIDPDSRFGVVAGHGGAGPGYSAGAFHFPNVRGRRVTSVALANRDAYGLGIDVVFAMVETLAELDPADVSRLLAD